MEMHRGGQSIVGFPALVDHGVHVEIEIFDEPDLAAARHRAGLRRLVSLQIREPLKYLEKNLPDLQRMAAAYMPLGTLEDLRGQILEVAIDRAFLADALPGDAAAFEATVSRGRARLTLIAQEVARLVADVLGEFTMATRKLKDSKPPKDVADDLTGQLQRLVPRRFVVDTPYAQLHHLPRYLKAVTMRLDKQRADPARDAARLAELRPIEQRFWRRVAERKGATDAVAAWSSAPVSTSRATSSLLCPVSVNIDADSLPNVSEPVAIEQPWQSAQDVVRKGRTFVDQCRVHLHEGGAGSYPFVCGLG